MKKLRLKFAKVSAYSMLTIAVVTQMLFASTTSAYAVEQIAPIIKEEPTVIQELPTSEPEIIVNEDPTQTPEVPVEPQLPTETLPLPEIIIPELPAETEEVPVELPPVVEPEIIVPEAPFTVTKDADVKMYYNRSVEQYVNYGIAIYNGSTNKFPGGTITDYIPAGVEALGGEGWVCSDTNGDGIVTNGEPCVFENVPPLEVNDFYHVVLPVKVQFNLDGMKEICNTAVVSIEGITESSPADCRPVVNEPVPFTLDKQTDVEIVYDGFPDQYIPYDITLTNDSETRVFPGGTLMEYVPAGTIYVGGDEWACLDESGNGITGDAGDYCYSYVPTVNPLQTYEKEFLVVAISNLSAVKEICNEVAVVPYDSNNKTVAGPVCTQIIQNTDNDFTLEKTANVSQVYRGQITEIVYTLTLRNHTADYRGFNFVDRLPEGVVVDITAEGPNGGTWVSCQSHDGDDVCDGGDLAISNDFNIAPGSTFTVNLHVLTDDLTGIDQLENLAGAFLDVRRGDDFKVAAVIGGEDCGNEYVICSNLHIINVLDMPQTPETPTDPDDDGTVLGTSTGGTLANTGFNLATVMAVAGAALLTGTMKLTRRKLA